MTDEEIQKQVLKHPFLTILFTILLLIFCITILFSLFFGCISNFFEVLSYHFENKMDCQIKKMRIDI
jgi:hypothetical protein